MPLIGLVRVSTDKQNTQRQHDALDPICWKVFEEKTSGKLATDDRPALLEALSHIRDGDMLTVQEVDRLGRNLLEGLIVLNDLFQRGVAVKVLEGIAGGEHTERSLILDLALALAEDRLRTLYDLVSFDPRGVGQSDPVNCLQRAVNAYLLDGKVPADGTTCS
jgi:DNA invertase Pin-like site-specific DNA recombinase